MAVRFKQSNVHALILPELRPALAIWHLPRDMPPGSLGQAQTR